jgi:flagellar biosynthesis activator protein FlaF
MYAQLANYKRVEKVTIPDGRELEASVLTKAAQLLTYCKNNWQAEDRIDRLSEALKFNQKVWSLFQAELATPENPLPHKIREDLLNLSLFIDKRTLDILVDPAPDKLNILVKINLNIAAGLKTVSDN